MPTQRFFCQEDKRGLPIPGTMMGFFSAPRSTGTNLVEIPTTTATGTVQVVHPKGLRYFVRRDKNNNIIPNSLFTSLVYPSGNVLEFKLFSS